MVTHPDNPEGHQPDNPNALPEAPHELKLDEITGEPNEDPKLENPASWRQNELENIANPHLKQVDPAAVEFIRGLTGMPPGKPSEQAAADFFSRMTEAPDGEGSAEQPADEDVTAPADKAKAYQIALEVDLQDPEWPQALKARLMAEGMPEDLAANAAQKAYDTITAQQQADAKRAAQVRELGDSVLPPNWRYPAFGRVLAAATQAITLNMMGQGGFDAHAIAADAVNIAEAVGDEIRARAEAYITAQLDTPQSAAE
jgi:hypothetical protein